MTKRRDPLTPFLALTRAAGRLSWETIAGITGRSVRTVQNWSDPDTKSMVSIGHALEIDLACEAAGDAPPIFTWLQQQLKLAAVERGTSRATIAKSAAAVAKEVGESQAAAIAVLAPGSGAVELLIAEREAAEAYEAQGRLLHDIRAVREQELDQ